MTPAHWIVLIGFVAVLLIAVAVIAGAILMRISRRAAQRDASGTHRAESHPPYGPSSLA